MWLICVYVYVCVTWLICAMQGAAGGEVRTVFCLGPQRPQGLPRLPQNPVESLENPWNTIEKGPQTPRPSSGHNNIATVKFRNSKNAKLP